MTEHKFTEDEIIRALECCKSVNNVCDNCPMPSTLKDDCKCGEHLAKNALDLINRQRAEIERLKKIGDYKTSEVLRHDAAIRELSKQLETAKAEAIKEFAERLREHYDEYDDYDDIYARHIRDDIDSLVQEMTEGK